MGLSQADLIGIYGDADLNRAVSRFMQRSAPKRGSRGADLHGLVGILGFTGTGAQPIAAGDYIDIPVVKPVEIYEWTLDADQTGSLALTVSYAPWAIPRVFTSITTNSATQPSISGGSNNGSNNLNGWTVVQHRKSVIRVAAASVATNILQATFVLYVAELPRGGPVNS